MTQPQHNPNPRKPKLMRSTIVSTLWLLAGFALAAPLHGCVSFDPTTARTVADVTLLEGEYEQARARLMALPFSPAETAIVEHGIDELDRIRAELHRATASADNAALAAMNYMAGESLLDQAAGAYESIYSAYTLMLKRTGRSPVDPFLATYDRSARQAYRSLVDLIPRQGGITLAQTSGYLGYILRGYALYRTGGAAALG